MRIALLTDGVHPYVIGGMQKHSFYMARELARKKHTVYLFHYNESSYDASRLEFFTDEEKQYIKPFLLSFPYKRYFPLHYLYESFQYSRTVYEALKPILPETDFIFAQGFCAWALLKHKQEHSMPPVAVHFHGFEMFQNIPSAKAKFSRYFLQKAVKANLRKTDYAISYGGKISTILKGMLAKNKLWEIPAGIEPTWLTESAQAKADNVRFAFIGRYERRKGLPELNTAIRQLLQKAKFTVDFIGEIPPSGRIDNPAMHYHGKLSSETEIKRILSGCDVLVCPSYSEGMPNVIMEAMACGLAVIATDAGAVSMLAGTDNGWLIESPAPNLIEKAMIEAITAPAYDLNNKKARSCEKIKEYFLIETVTNKLVYLIEQAIK